MKFLNYITAIWHSYISVIPFAEFVRLVHLCGINIHHIDHNFDLSALIIIPVRCWAINRLWGGGESASLESVSRFVYLRYWFDIWLYWRHFAFKSRRGEFVNRKEPEIDNQSHCVRRIRGLGAVDAIDKRSHRQTRMWPLIDNLSSFWAALYECDIGGGPYMAIVIIEYLQMALASSPAWTTR